MSDLQELFARLNGQGSAAASPSASNQQQPAGPYRQPSVSSPIFSPSPNGPQPHHASAVISPNVSNANTPVPEGAQQTPQQQSAQLLNLLRFGSQSSVPQHPVQSQRRPSNNTQASDSHARQVSAGDLVATFMGTRSPSAVQQSTVSATPPARQEQPSLPSENPQDLLLRLLNHPKPAQSEVSKVALPFASSPPPQAPETAVGDMADAGLSRVPSTSDAHQPHPASSPMRIFGSDGATQSSSFEPETAPNRTKFTYVNPFDKLEAASPRIRTPVQSGTKPPSSKVEILKSDNGTAAANGERHAKSRRVSVQPEHHHETVAEAVNELGEQLGREVGEALAEAEYNVEAQLTEEAERLDPDIIKEVEEVMVETAVELNKELEDEQTAKELEKTAGKPIAEALKKVAAEVAQGDVADSWESAEAEDSAKDEDQTVTVYTFPMKAFASITVQNMPQRRPTLRTDAVMDIARLKKEFDQIDRALVSATKDFIVYTLVKKGGFKIIRQETGQYRQVFENHNERMFNIALCTTGDKTGNSPESVLGIGVNGSVFWTSLVPMSNEQFSETLDTNGIVLPPSPTQDDNTSGGQLKTRAKPSSRHPEFFAVGRGKSIHIVWPQVAATYVRGGKNICQTDKYLKERSLRILTGKAGKDFSFSEDDTVIVSLDKAGRMRFWDIRRLTDPELGFPGNAPQQIEVSETLLEFHTISPATKSWPTSVFFFDKDKPFNKGIALRYVMVGMKQNHSFQLWDLGLGKAVQEINLPHEKESDAICSVSFHPKTGIMAVAHPTRNSIFFIHVSCPRYTLPVMSQATYIGRLASKGTERAQLPPVNATAIMTSITEYSFAPKGQIRSLFMLNEPAGPPDVDEPENTALFELYVMHSKGVCTIRLRRSDLGWKKEGEPLHPKKADEEGIITISNLKTPIPVQDESSTGGETPAQKTGSDRSARESIKKDSSNVSRQTMTPEAAMRASTLAKVESKQDAARAAIINGGEKPEKKKKKRAQADTSSQASSAPRLPPSYAQAAQNTSLPKSPVPPEGQVVETPSKSSDAETPEWAKKLINQHFQQPASAGPTPKMDSNEFSGIVSAELDKVFAREISGLYKRIDEDKKVMNAANGAKQEAILRMVSQTLTDNVEGVIRSMVEKNTREVLVPKMIEHMSNSIEKNLSSTIKSNLGGILAKEIPASVSLALKNPQILQGLSDTVAKKVNSTIEPIMVASTASVITPAIANMSNLIEQRIGEQFRVAQAQQQSDSLRIAQLSETVENLMQIVQAMASAQTKTHDHLMKLSQASQLPAGPSPTHVSPPSAAKAPPQKTPEELEAEAITRLMTEGSYEQGTMRWLQSNRTTELFNTVFVKCNPAYLAHVSPLLNLSTGAVVTDSMEQNLMERLIWLDAVLKNVDPRDTETHDIVPKIMDVMNQRLTATYIKINETQPGNPILRRISSLVTKVNDLARAVNA